MVAFALVSILAAAASVSAAPAAPIVNLPYGRFRGAIAADGKTASFLGIPYAQAPVGELRFRPSKALEPVNKCNTPIRNATLPGFSCMQAPSPIFDGPWFKAGEDCLNVNVFAPANAEDNSKLPVLVYFYGGSFNDGFNNQPFIQGATFFAAAAEKQQAVIVVPNYRTNAFGFLASAELAKQDSLNVGLLDQKLAFEWVRNNIAQFGGNPESVTAWGQSAGAISIATHLVAQDGQAPLFDRAILQSGGLLPIYNTPTTAQAAFNKLATAVNCNTAADVVACMQKVDAAALYAAANKAGISYGPAVDGKYIKEQPRVAIAAGKIRKIPLLLLDNRDEGTYFVFPSAAALATADAVKAYQRNAFPYLTDAAFAQLQALYPIERYPLPVVAAADSFGNAIFNCPELQLAETLSALQVPVYKARFNVQPATLPLPAFAQLGVYHGAELPFVWNFVPFLNSTVGENVIAAGMVRSYLDFAAGKAPGSSLDAPWPVYRTDAKTTNQVSIQLAKNGKVDPIDQITAARCAFWTENALAAAKFVV
ncbi:Alpha/Beta hydrolase protein [Entophlyctis helioformis]|nr:Alpha/Beta hydrolase protein [Entophlyctis helioformis]